MISFGWDHGPETSRWRLVQDGQHFRQVPRTVESHPLKTGCVSRCRQAHLLKSSIRAEPNVSPSLTNKRGTIVQLAQVRKGKT
jgi:hypothetical protein